LFERLRLAGRKEIFEIQLFTACDWEGKRETRERERESS
jgi:hypothetical protein